MNKKKKAKPRKIVIEDIDTTLLKKVFGADGGPGGSQGCSDTNSCTCACQPDNQY